MAALRGIVRELQSLMPADVRERQRAATSRGALIMAGGEHDARSEALARIRDNAFYVLELTPTCSRLDMERQGQKLLAMLELRLAAAVTYATPVGQRMRDADKVRLAMARLRDPDKRLEEELWARLDANAKWTRSGGSGRGSGPAGSAARAAAEPAVDRRAGRAGLGRR